ncbi:hypothetical protein KP509_22G048400 [Ceratopteris richardii]|uniref:Small auxin up regulated protein n=1 Tax=Ceratopteris richardii TaxID=49495 RepID=A0A8T2S822_CERRI|nr:hypothetical protein KP509_22G048400 [Ceratopteris richardii]
MSASAGIAAVKIQRIKSFLKRWHSLAKVREAHLQSDTTVDDVPYMTSALELVGRNDEEYIGGSRAQLERREATAALATGELVPEGFAVAFVGSRRRKYVVRCEHLDHPLFQELRQRSEALRIDQSSGPALGCEVVLFEHLLWLLDSDDLALHTDCIQELADLYMPRDG